MLVPERGNDMDFPIGSLAVLVAFILVSSGIIPVEETKYKLLVVGLAGVFIGGFLSLPLPSPQGMQVSLNAGHTLIPVLISFMFWPETEAEDKYRTISGILVVGLVLYGLVTLLDLEPGMVQNPLWFSVPVISGIALLTARTAQGSAISIAGGSLLVVIIRYLDLAFSPEPRAFLELPGELVWNTASLGVFASVGVMLSVNGVKSRLVQHWKTWHGSAEIDKSTGEISIEQEELLPLK